MVASWVTTSTDLPTTWEQLESGLAECCSDIELAVDIVGEVEAYAPKPTQRVVAVKSEYESFHARLTSATLRQGGGDAKMCLAIASHNLRPLVQGWFTPALVNAWLQADTPLLSDLFLQADKVQKGNGQVFLPREQEFKSFLAGAAGPHINPERQAQIQDFPVSSDQQDAFLAFACPCRKPGCQGCGGPQRPRNAGGNGATWGAYSPTSQPHASSTARELCRDFQMGRCFRNSCHFSHEGYSGGKGGNQGGKGSWGATTRACYQWENDGTCSYMERYGNCNFSHEKGGKGKGGRGRRMHPYGGAGKGGQRKCFRWENTGSFQSGDVCSFSHDRGSNAQQEPAQSANDFLLPEQKKEIAELREELAARNGYARLRKERAFSLLTRSL